MTPQPIIATGNRSTRRYWVGSNRRHDRFNPRVFGTLLLTMMGILIIILKIMNDYAIGKDTSLYYELNGIMLSLPIFIAFAITMILHRLVMGYKTMILMFVFWLIISYLIITPVVLSGV